MIIWPVLLFVLMSATKSLGDSFEFDLGLQYDTESIDESLTGKYKQSSDSSLLWGPYRSGLYFGIRPRIPRSVLSGLMWFNMDTYNGVQKIRHFYEQHDSMKKANWVYYDPRFGGRQVINDRECHINLVIDFIKSADGNSWGAKVKLVPHKGFEQVKTSLIWYSCLETNVKEVDMLGQEKGNGILDLDMNIDFNSAYLAPMKLKGISEELGMFDIVITEGASNQYPESFIEGDELDPKLTHHTSLRVPNDQIWQAKDIFMTLLQDSMSKTAQEYPEQEVPPYQSYILRDLNKFQGNAHFFQKVYQGGGEFDVTFNNVMTPDSDKIHSHNFKQKTLAVLNKFHTKFAETFTLNAPFDTKEYVPFAKELLSGLLGGASYFYGDHLVDRETQFDEEAFEKYELKGTFEGPHELFSLVPSRPFFPRGFLWDEGFHVLPLLEYDSDLVLEIIQSWYKLIDDDGWIAREQILGPELRARVPEEFQVQSPQIINPPTLMLAFTLLLENSDNTPAVISNYGGMGSMKDELGHLVINHRELLTNYSKQIYPRLKSHYNMFKRTQKGYFEDFDRSKDMEAYRWRGRTETHCLASGLDDYPRAFPADIAELNVDLLSWMGVMARCIKLIAQTLDNTEDIKYYQAIEDDVVSNLDAIHWSHENGVYCDVSVNEDDEEVHVCYKGYVSIFPFITKMMKPTDHEKLGKIIDFISDPQQLWSDYGLRSISKSDPTYRTGENYWRSPVWININYLALDALKTYKQMDIPPALALKIGETYHKLRLNVVNNVFNEWKRTGFVWEQYDDETGTAKGAKNFLGWSSTVILMMKMPEYI